MIVLAGLLRFKWTYLVTGVIIVGIGLVAYVSAHPSQPVEIDGTIASYSEFTRNGAYDRNELQMTGDSNTYTLHRTAFHPALPDSLYRNGKVQIWIDGGSTTIIAIALYDDQNENPVKYTTGRYDNPGSERSDGQGLGMEAGAIGALLVGVFGLWFALGRRRRTAMPVAGSAGAPPPPVA